MIGQLVGHNGQRVVEYLVKFLSDLGIVCFRVLECGEGLTLDQVLVLEKIGRQVKSTDCGVFVLNYCVLDHAGLIFDQIERLWNVVGKKSLNSITHMVHLVPVQVQRVLVNF
ncbi:hypothetical protein BpHYR1_013515 [Brachionus plicatilis]|uniref:Uncharacterized protein n=1 Tax=Brachionus plicatilis TaxID=10195 RepID=A0A3M7PLM5_BRAPC|nr:hypothetical protein BpHYR1_013515 [Brachionus plicatilis]